MFKEQAGEAGNTAVRWTILHGITAGVGQRLIGRWRGWYEAQSLPGIWNTWYGCVGLRIHTVVNTPENSPASWTEQPTAHENVAARYDCSLRCVRWTPLKRQVPDLRIADYTGGATDRRGAGETGRSYGCPCR